MRPQSATTRTNLAVALANFSRTDEAIAQFEEALELDPDSGVLHYNLGKALSKDHRKKAIQHLQRASELNPTLATAQCTLADYWMQDHRYSEAAASLRYLLTLSTDNIERSELEELLRRCTTEQGAQ